MKNTRPEHKKRNLIGSKVRKARLSHKPAISQDDLAGRVARFGIVLDRSAISRIESRERYVMDYEARALAKALSVPVGWFFGEVDLPSRARAKAVRLVDDPF